MQEILVYIILGAALFYSLKKCLKLIKGKSKCGGCSSGVDKCAIQTIKSNRASKTLYNIIDVKN